MPPRQRRRPAERVEEPVEQPSTPVVVERTEDSEVVLPAWVPPKIQPEIVHPAWIGYQKTHSGIVLIQPHLVHPAFAGIAFVKAPPIVSSDPRSHHPAAFGFYEAARNDGVDAFDPALVSPIFAHSALRPIPPPYVEEQLAARTIPPIAIHSEAGEYLQAQVWLTLNRALECMLAAMKKSVPRDQRTGMTMEKLLAANPKFNATRWIAQYLKAYNPNRPPRFSRNSAAIVIQAGFRGHLVRKEVRRLREIHRKAEAAAELVRRRNRAATLIQACYRGHRVRVYLAMGRRLDGHPLVSGMDRRPVQSTHEGATGIFVS